MKSFLQVGFSSKFVANDLLKVDAFGNGCQEMLREIYSKIIEKGLIKKIVGLVNSLEMDELFDENFVLYEALIAGSIYFSDGSIHNEITDYLHDEILNNMDSFGFSKECKNHIDTLFLNKMFNPVLHDLTLNNIVLVSRYTVIKKR